MLHPTIRCALVLLVAPLLSAGRADAQWNGFLNINGSVQTDDRTVTHILAETVYGEEANYKATMTSPGGTVLDVWAGGRVWGNLGIGVGATVLNARGTTAVSGSVPSPLFSGRDRYREAPPLERPGLKHQQVGLHLPIIYMVPVSDRVHVVVSAGPSWFRLRHDALATVTRTAEAAPYTEVALADFTPTVEEGTGIGYNAGLDVTYLLTRFFGVGLFLRYTGGSVEMPFPDGAQAVKVGGVQGGAGLRFRF
ncbi:MAG: outer membrane beta-barrel protein [Acidobacteria bacterium]|nr:outer membrane beta-barrel protein [Acidobacteriota bacterium]